MERRKIPLRRSPPPLLQQATGASDGRGRNGYLFFILTHEVISDLFHISRLVPYLVLSYSQGERRNICRRSGQIYV